MSKEADNSLYPIAVLIDELRNDDVQVRKLGFPLVSFGNSDQYQPFYDPKTSPEPSV